MKENFKYLLIGLLLGVAMLVLGASAGNGDVGRYQMYHYVVKTYDFTSGAVKNENVVVYILDTVTGEYRSINTRKSTIESFRP
jgi:hypothetical protein